MPARAPIDRAQFQRILRRNVTLPMVVGVASALAFVGFVWYFLSVMSWVDHTQQVIVRTNELMTLNADMESGMRGYALGGQEALLAPFQVARPLMQAEVHELAELVADNPVQLERLRRIEALQLEWQQYAQVVIDAKKAGGDVAALVRSETGRQLQDRIRAEFTATRNGEANLLHDRNEAARAATSWGIGLYVTFIFLVFGFIAYAGRRDIVKLSSDFSGALQAQVAAGESLQEQAWLRDGQSKVAERLAGQQTLGVIGRSVLAFMGDYLEPVVAAVYVRDASAKLRLVSTYGIEPPARGEGGAEGPAGPDPQEGLVEQVARDGRLQHVRAIDSAWFRVATGLAEGAPAEIVLAPTTNDGIVNGVIELGFLRPVGERDLTLLELVGGVIGASIDAAQYRKRLQEAVEETQALNEELQVQQEELRTTNEELAEQSRVLTESQTHLEHQQAELQQTNAQLAEQAQVLDRRNEALKEAQASLRERATELQRASRYKSEFLANMSHELRTPLNSSLILAKLLAENREGNLHPEQLKFAQTIYSAGNDLLNLINDILDLSKVEAGRLDLRPQYLSVHKLVDGLQRTFTPLAEEKQLALEVHVAPDAPVSMVSDGLRIEQVLKNLLSNAIKFTEQGGWRSTWSRGPPGASRSASATRASASPRASRT
jgi:signal transduction histidine kinase/CHASE3 domain sensor protein